MTAPVPAGEFIGGAGSLEVRWIFPGLLEAAVVGWFGRFPAEVVTLEDTYLLAPELRGLSVKVRSGAALEVKMYRGSPGILEVAGSGRGRLESWQKWSFPSRQGGGDAPGWLPVRKRRRISRFWLAGERTAIGAQGPSAEPGCAVELTEVRTRGEAWWSLGFEATGPADLLRGELEATATLVFAQVLPGSVELSLDDSMSYTQWLRGRI